MEVGSRYYVALDLGQAMDFTALAVLERLVTLGPRDMATYEWRKEVSLRLRHVERMSLGTSYPAVVERVRGITGSRELEGRCELVVDGTGVGRPVVDLLRGARLGCRILPVTITGGDSESYSDGYHRVPKRDLVTGLQLLVQQDRLQIAAKMKDAEVLLREMREMQVRVTDAGREQFGVWRSGSHDDLVLAVALSAWAANRVLPVLRYGTTPIV